jgi:hypothetical protein
MLLCKRWLSFPATFAAIKGLYLSRGWCGFLLQGVLIFFVVNEVNQNVYPSRGWSEKSIQRSREEPI